MSKDKIIEKARKRKWEKREIKREQRGESVKSYEEEEDHDDDEEDDDDEEEDDDEEDDDEEEEEDDDDDDDDDEVPTINEALQAIRVVHNFYEATSENVQLICDLERIERDLQMQIFATRRQTNNIFLQ